MFCARKKEEDRRTNRARARAGLRALMNAAGERMMFFFSLHAGENLWKWRMLG